MTIKLTWVEGNEYRDESSAWWIRTPGDAFANDTLACTVCDALVDGGEDAFLCVDGGDVAHIDCVEVSRGSDVFPS